MTPLVHFFDRPLLHALGWTLIHFLWQAAIVALLLACGLALLRHRSPQLRYALACLALGIMVAMPVVTFVYLAAEARGETQFTPGLSAQLIPAAGLGGNLPLSSEAWFDRLTHSLDRAMPVVLGVWFAGVILLLARLNLGLLAAQQMKSREAFAAPDELQSVLRDLAHRIAVARTVRLFSSAMVQVPTVVGWLKPVILLPAGCLAGLSPVQIEALLAHELAHIRRHDYLVSVLQSLSEALLFYHPAVWWVSGRIRQERELCCDDLAVAISQDSLAYAKALSLLEELRSAQPLLGLGAHGGALTMRITRLLKVNRDPGISRVAAVTLTAAAVAIAICIAAGTRLQANAAVPHNEAQTRLSSQYRTWLDKDVRWIITPEERAQFLALHDNSERQQFITQFWERRNPNPGSAENTFKEEHYRRIAYANQHFSAGGPGWESGRGHIYILYGPPDSIDAHPRGGDGAAAPFEVWYYRAIEEYAPPTVRGTGLKAGTVTKKDVDIRFVDSCRCGIYELASPANP